MSNANSKLLVAQVKITYVDRSIEPTEVFYASNDEEAAAFIEAGYAREADEAHQGLAASLGLKPETPGRGRPKSKSTDANPEPQILADDGELS